MMLMMYYTMSRSESPLPKTANSFDSTKHIRRRDVRLLNSMYVEWGLGSIKQDQRSKRSKRDPDKRDWKPCGECDGVLSMRNWFDAYEELSSWSDEQQPFFYDDNGKPLTYSFMLNFMRSCMARCDGVSQADADLYGFHGIRVLGYNCWRAAEGEDVAALQGGWGSLAHRLYGRQMLMKILGMAEKGAHYAAANALAPMPLDGALPPQAVTTVARPLPMCLWPKAGDASPLVSAHPHAYDATHNTRTNLHHKHHEHAESHPPQAHAGCARLLYAGTSPCKCCEAPPCL